MGEFMTRGRSKKGRRDQRSARRAETEERRRPPWRRGDGSEGPKALQFTRLNWALLLIAGVLIVSGYVTLASSSPFLSTVVAPVLLVAGYAVFIPLGLIV